MMENNKKTDYDLYPTKLKIVSTLGYGGSVYTQDGRIISGEPAVTISLDINAGICEKDEVAKAVRRACQKLQECFD